VGQTLAIRSREIRGLAALRQKEGASEWPGID